MKKFVISVLAASFVTIAACIPPLQQYSTNNLSGKGKSNSYDNTVSEEIKQKVAQMIKNKPVYKGPIEIKVNTGLYENNRPKVFSVKASSISIPPEKIIYTDTFNLNNGNVNLRKVFNVPDTTKRYTLLVKKNLSNINIKVNINGFDWLTSPDSNHGNEIIKDKYYT